ncbi:ERMES complex subunit [Thecaphora frezii]
MSFNFKWPTFSKEFHESAAQMLDSALNKGPKPKVIADDIKVEELDMGTIPPELEILEIGDLGTDRFRGIFRLTYAGDAHLVLKTKVQANPLSKPNRPDIGLFPSSTASRGILFAAAPLVVPMHLRLSDVKLRAIVVLVVSKAKGITLVFKNDPLESVQVSSTFDSVAVLQKYLQQEIETQLREMFREDLPGIIHRLSQRWLSGEAKHEREEARLRREGQPQQQPQQQQQQAQQYRVMPLPRSTSDPYGGFQAASAPGGSGARSGARSKSRRRPSDSASTAGIPTVARKTPPTSPPRRRGSGRRSKHTSKAASMSAAPLFNELLSSSASGFGSSFPEIENYDPTYGLRPDDLPTHSGFSGLGKLAQRISGGLRDLTSASQEESVAISGGGAAAKGDHVGLPRSFSSGSEGQEMPDSSGVDTDATDPEAEDDADGFSSQDDVSDSMLDDEDNEDVDDDVEEDQDDVPDLAADTSADTSIDYTRFGYPPASAAFSDTHEVNRASSIIFDNTPGPPSRRGRRRSGSSGRAGLGAASAVGPHHGGSIRSARTSSSGRRKASAVEYETIPAVGGGTVTRPRIYHSASKVQPPEVDWDDESTARPSQYGCAGSSRTGGATRYGSDMGSTTFGAQSSRTNTVRGPSSPPLEAERFPDGSEESLMELPPESMHSSDRSHRVTNAQGWRSGSSASSASPSARQSSSGHGSGLYASGRLSRARSAQYTSWGNSASSSAPTSLHPSGLGSPSDLGLQRDSPDAYGNRGSSPNAGGSGGIRLRKGKNIVRPRHAASASLDRTGFVTLRYTQRDANVYSTPPRTHAWSQPRDAAPPATLAGSSPDLSATDPANGFAGHGELSTSPFSNRDLLSSSPSFQGGSRSHLISGASHALQQASGGGGGSGHGAGGTAKMSIDASAHFADLVKSNHTLSPFTRNMEHFTVRSAPVTPGGHFGGGGGGGSSVVGSTAASSNSAASGSGAGIATGKRSSGSQHGAYSASASSRSFAGNRGAPVVHHAAATAGTAEAPPLARRRRTFQLGGRQASSSSSPVTAAAAEADAARAKVAAGPDAAAAAAYHRRLAAGQAGFAPYAGQEARGFATPPLSSSASSSSSGVRRSRPGSMGPPSEAARLNAARWEAIRE